MARREITNLKKIREAGIRCPQPVMFQRHVVIMSFIGENKTSAPQLKNVKLEPNESVTAYNEVNISIINTILLFHILRMNNDIHFGIHHILGCVYLTGNRGNEDHVPKGRFNTYRYPGECSLV